MYCSNCGAEASRNLNYCNKCGADLQLPAAYIAPDGKDRNDGTAYIAMALGFSVCICVVALAVTVIKLAQAGVDGFGIGLVSIACAGVILGIAHLLVDLMKKLNGVAGEEQATQARRKGTQAKVATTQRALDEHRETVPPFSSITDRTTKIFEPAHKPTSGNL